MQYSLCALLARFYLPQERTKGATKIEKLYRVSGLATIFIASISDMSIFIVIKHRRNVNEQIINKIPG